MHEMNLAEDCVQMLVLSSFRDHAKAKCGFVDHAVECIYQRYGFGCPYQSLSPAESEERNNLQLGKWCHWTYGASRLGISEQSDR